MTVDPRPSGGPSGLSAGLPARRSALEAALAARLSGTAGRLVAVALFGAMLALFSGPAWPAVVLVLALTSLLPRHRRPLLAVAALVAIAVEPPLDLAWLGAAAEARGAAAWLGAWPLVVALTLVLGCAHVELARRQPKSFAGQRPVLALLLLLTALLALAGSGALTGGAWLLASAFAMSLGSYVWFFAWATSEAKATRGEPAAAQVGFWRPFWGFSNVPLGKGAAYLAKVEAKDDEALARAQLAGLALMAWALVLGLAMDAFQAALYLPRDLGGAWFAWVPDPGLPRLAVVIDAQAAGDPFPFAIRWASVVGEFVLSVLHMMTWGHPIVATCRMAGFHIAPNTDRALASTSVAEFYNRFYFYFKELLVAFFFYPAFLRFPKRWPRLRLAVATMASAGFGNFLFHFYRDSTAILERGFLRALADYHVYGCYAALLALSIALSQSRRGLRSHPPTGLRRALAVAAVLAWYCLLNAMDTPTPHRLPAYLGLYASLVSP